MIVGFKITAFNGHERDAVAFIQRVCILSDPQIAENIVAAGPGINIYSESVTQAMLNEQAFTASLLKTTSGKYMLVSMANFLLELPYNGGTLRLWPTEFARILPSEVEQFQKVYEQKLVRFYPEL